MINFVPSNLESVGASGPNFKVTETSRITIDADGTLH